MISYFLRLDLYLSDSSFLFTLFCMYGSLRSLLFLAFLSSGSFSFAGSNETLFTILSATGFSTAVAGPVTSIAVNDVYCEEKTSSKKVKCTASQSGQVLEISDSKLFLAALRGEATGLEPAAISAKKVIYSLTSLTCSSRVASPTSTPFYSCNLTPLER